MLSVRNLACADCGEELEQRALAKGGVRSAHFDPARLELRLETAPGTAPGPIIDALQAEPIDGRPIVALVGPGQGSYAPFQPLQPEWDAKVLSAHGEDVDGFEPTPGRVTVVDFFAEWCGPCHELDDVMHRLLTQDPTRLAYRRLNIVDWDSPVARHYLGQAPELPHVIVLDVHGREVARLSGLKPSELEAAIAKGHQP